MNQKKYNQSLFQFIDSSPSPFHAVDTIRQQLHTAGFTRLYEDKKWELKKGKSYFIIRDQGAIIAFTLGKEETVSDGFRIITAHTDSPGLKIKPNAESTPGSLVKLGVEIYGSPLLSTWFDRELRIAGRICYINTKNEVCSRLVRTKNGILYIPSVAVHLHRDAHTKNEINQQNHLPPLLGQNLAQIPLDLSTILQTLAKENFSTDGGEKPVSFDLFCADSTPAGFTGVNSEFIAAPQLDNLLSCHAGMHVLKNSNNRKNVLLFCANHEENGSLSDSGAQGSFIEDVFTRICDTPGKYHICKANSFIVSVDNAHATHPNYADKSDKNHEIHLNKGPVIKINANQRYTTSAISSAIYKAVCRSVDINPQEFVMRSDMPCGSTIGPIVSSKLGISSVDIGAATLGMHSIRELTGSTDPLLLYSTLLSFAAGEFHKVKLV